MCCPPGRQAHPLAVRPGARPYSPRLVLLREPRGRIVQLQRGRLRRRLPRNRSRYSFPPATPRRRRRRYCSHQASSGGDYGYREHNSRYTHNSILSAVVTHSRKAVIVTWRPGGVLSSRSSRRGSGRGLDRGSPAVVSERPGRGRNRVSPSWLLWVSFVPRRGASPV